MILEAFFVEACLSDTDYWCGIPRIRVLVCPDAQKGGLHLLITGNQITEVA